MCDLVYYVALIALVLDKAFKCDLCESCFPLNGSLNKHITFAEMQHTLDYYVLLFNLLIHNSHIIHVKKHR